MQLAISTDSNGYPINATLIASILRRTELPAHVRCWCRGFLPESFESGPLKVEFLPALEAVTGRYPGTSGPSAYDRLLVIRDCPDWDRCMVMDYDQLALCDLTPLFSIELVTVAECSVKPRSGGTCPPLRMGSQRRRAERSVSANHARAIMHRPSLRKHDC